MDDIHLGKPIIEFAVMEHGRDLIRTALGTPERTLVSQRQARIEASFANPQEAIVAAMSTLGRMIREADLPKDPGIAVHPSRYTALARELDGYLQGLGFKSMETSLVNALQKRGEHAPALAPVSASTEPSPNAIKMAQAVVGMLATENIQKAEVSSDAVFQARVKRHLKDAHTLRPLQEAVAGIIDAHAQEKAGSLRPPAILGLAQAIEHYFKGQGFRANTETIYSCINYVQEQFLRGR